MSTCINFDYWNSNEVAMCAYLRCKKYVSSVSNSSRNGNREYIGTMHYVEFVCTKNFHHCANKFDHRNIVRPIFSLQMRTRENWWLYTSLAYDKSTNVWHILWLSQWPRDIFSHTHTCQWLHHKVHGVEFRCISAHMVLQYTFLWLNHYAQREANSFL